MQRGAQDNYRLMQLFILFKFGNIIQQEITYAISAAIWRTTVLVLIKLTKFVVALRLRCGSCKLIF